MNNLAVDTLHWISGALLIPDVVLLIGFAAFALLQIGGLAGEAWTRTRTHAPWRAFIRGIGRDPKRRLRLNDVPIAHGLSAAALQRAKANPHATERVLDEVQLEVESRLDRLLLGVRLGPILGLAGTLIPLGPTLLALTRWDLATLSAQLVIAFNATVVGLFIGGVCYAVQLVRRRWYRSDFADLEFVFGRLEE